MSSISKKLPVAPSPYAADTPDRDTLAHIQNPEIDARIWHPVVHVRNRDRYLLKLQRLDAKAAFLRHFMAWVREQSDARKLSNEILGRRLGLTAGIVVRHFRYPETMPLEYVIWYQLALGVCFDFIPLPVTRLSEMPGYKPPA
jgi:hypothetical protein